MLGCFVFVGFGLLCFGLAGENSCIQLPFHFFCEFPVVDRPCPVLARQCRKKKRVEKKFFRFEDVHVERCNSRSTTERTHEMEHFELFCRIPSLHGENGMFCKSGKRSF